MDRVSCAVCYRMLEEAQALKEGWLIRPKALNPLAKFVLCDECQHLDRRGPMPLATLEVMDDNASRMIEVRQRMVTHGT